MPRSLAIRAADSADLLPLADLARVTFTQAFEADMGAEAIRTHLSKHLSDDAFAEMLRKDCFFVVEDGHSFLGFVQVGLVSQSYADHLDSFDPSGGEVKRLYVLETHQGSGLGSALLERGLGELASKSQIYITTWESNQGAQKLYRSFGFSEICQIPEYAANGELQGYERVMARST